MAEQDEGLTSEEHAELERLRAEKAAREQAEQAKRERAELERLRAEREEAERTKAEDQHIAEVRERNRKLMEPDEDLKMPFAQKLTLALLAVFVVAVVFYLTIGH
ncbi:MAG: hypothetical protein LKG38_04730 [Atopobiaceae bacterium]|jgi:Flp pilus assembly protein TadB|nr:hypothetical protein [Atopobiaceae bacterium]MCH4119580.1 hypothetical protein [Atopobiaceae bacterium]MCI1318631.1 hypothetical protein [Atopobiaceae bacterium]MCI1389535.1 hypothetical protein [Atopobiaceae bacterium]MCI1431599.1 hypothetical protein [Atopobiaceae bacterium]